MPLTVSEASHFTSTAHQVHTVCQSPQHVQGRHLCILPLLSPHSFSLTS
jgi:hypothetical protein